MATYEELMQSAEQIRTNELPESNTHELVGQHLKNQVEYSKNENNGLKTLIDNNKKEVDGKISLLGNNVFRTGSGGYLPWQAGKTYNDGDVVIAPDGQLVECIGGTVSTSEYDPGEWAATTVDEQSRKRDTKISNIASSSGYVVCQTSASIAAKTITVDGITEITNKLRLLVQMNFANTAGGSVTLNINKLGAKTLYYNGATVSATNTWETGEVVELYYANDAFQCYNAKGGSGNGGNMILEWNTDVATTRKSVKAKDRKAGMQISYLHPENGWTNEQYISIEVLDTEWVKDGNWENIPSQKQITELNQSLSVVIPKSVVYIDNSMLNNQGAAVSNAGFRITEFINIANSTGINVSNIVSGSSYKSTAFYSDATENSFISYAEYKGSAEIRKYPQGAKYIRFTLAAKTETDIALLIPISEKVSELTQSADATITVTNIAGGYISATDGTFVTNASYRAIYSYIPVFGFTQIKSSHYRSGTSFTSFAFYDDNFELIEIVNENKNTVDIPYEAYYCRITVGTSDIPEVTITLVKYSADILSELLIDKEIVAETLFAKLKGKEVVFIGDSITAGFTVSDPIYTYFNVFAILAHCTATSVGVAGASYGDRGVTQIYEEIENVKGTEALAVMFAGTNDFGHDVEIGEPFVVEVETGQKSPNSDITTTAGGLHKAITDLRTKNSLMKIIVMTPLPRTEGSGGSFNSHRKNNAGNYLQDYADCIEEICAYYSIPCLRLDAICSMDATNPTINKEYYADGLHPNSKGHAELGRILYKFYQSL